MKNNILSAVACLLAPVSFAGEMNLPDGYEVVSSEEASMVIANTSTHGLMSYNRISAEGKKSFIENDITEIIDSFSCQEGTLFDSVKLIGTKCSFGGGKAIDIVMYLDGGRDVIHTVSVNEKVKKSDVVTFTENFATE
ncbi:MAG: hypothetical protein II847_02285 [Ruminobacter sp.]|uniref:hypothetical protein n=1 Tax=Ruminobacter sp. TaxID=2774296 RepID=UPI00257D92FF|nr:hypothetical protein [Ruminobacter sp.]MBQ3774942.1 hypothetical protein [Ruminobacter sp.]